MRKFIALFLVFFVISYGAYGCTTDSDCNDNDICTADICDSNLCTHQPLPCTDGDLCTSYIDCPLPPIPSYEQPECYVSFCDAGTCQYLDTCSVIPNPCDGLACDDGNVCTDNLCIPYPGQGCVFRPKDCSDGDACTVDSCNPVTGQCDHQPVSCAFNACLESSVCDPNSGTCVETPKDCDDGNLCTIDTCDPVSGCIHTPTDCSDGDLCTTDSCDANTGSCVHDSVDCSSGNVCFVSQCDPQIGCVPSAPLDCDDQDPCTDDSCDANSGCVHSSVVCPSDGCTNYKCVGVDSGLNECTSGPGCDAHVCQLDIIIICTDFNPCTIDSCVSGICSYFQDAMCTDAEVCLNNVCHSKSEPITVDISGFNLTVVNEGTKVTTSGDVISSDSEVYIEPQDPIPLLVVSGVISGAVIEVNYTSDTIYNNTDLSATQPSTIDAAFLNTSDTFTATSSDGVAIGNISITSGTSQFSNSSDSCSYEVSPCYSSFCSAIAPNNCAESSAKKRQLNGGSIQGFLLNFYNASSVRITGIRVNLIPGYVPLPDCVADPVCWLDMTCPSKTSYLSDEICGVEPVDILGLNNNQDLWIKLYQEYLSLLYSYNCGFDGDDEVERLLNTTECILSQNCGAVSPSDIMWNPFNSFYSELSKVNKKSRCDSKVLSCNKGGILKSNHNQDGYDENAPNNGSDINPYGYVIGVAAGMAVIGLAVAGYIRYRKRADYDEVSL